MRIHVAAAQQYGRQSILNEARLQSMVLAMNRMLHAASIQVARAQSRAVAGAAANPPPTANTNVFSSMVRFLLRVKVALQFDILRAQARVLKSTGFLNMLNYEADRCVVSVRRECGIYQDRGISRSGLFISICC